MRAPGRKTVKRAVATLSARLLPRVTLDAHADGKIVAAFDGRSLSLGTYGEDAASRAHDLQTGLPLGSFASDRNEPDTDVHRLIRRLAGHGLLEYRLASPDGADEVVIEPQGPAYWPDMPQLDPADILVLSRFSYLRRRGNEMVLESPRAGAVFRICDPQVAAALAFLATPHTVRRLRQGPGAPGQALLALLVGCGMLFKVDPARAGLRADEGGDDVVLWDFHDLLFHTRSTEGRHANPLGGVYPYAALIAPLPAVRPPWPGKRVSLDEGPAPPSRSGLAQLLLERHSVRGFDAARPITVAELSSLLGSAARVQSTWASKLEELGEDSPVVSYAMRPYPGAGAAYELELYLAVGSCEGLERGFYHYDANDHALVALDVAAPALEALLTSAEFAMGASGAPQVLITIAARFGRITWKYSSVAYALILKDVGVLTQTLYLTATDLGLGGCAIGSTNIDLFARMTGLDFWVEGAVGQFALGRPGESDDPQGP